MKNSMNIIAMLLAVTGILISGCSSDSSSAAKLNFMSGAIEALPQADSGSGSLIYANPLMAGLSSGVNITSIGVLDKFFDKQCFMPGQDDFCPTGTDTSGGDSSPYKFTSYTLLGLIYHAEMYSGGQHTSCDQGSAATINSASYKALTAGGDPHKFILDYHSLLNCLYEDPANDATSKRYTAYSADAASAYQATITTRNREPYNGITDPGQNDVFQVYVTNTSGTPSLLAFNYAGADTTFFRAILLVNLATNQFAVKYKSYAGSGLYDSVIAIGTGGVDRTTGTPNAGYYVVKYEEAGGGETEKCVNNADGMIETDMTSCDSASVPSATGTVTWDSTAVQTFLGMSATEITNLAPWLAKMTDATALPDADSPTSAAAGADPDINLPRTIEAAP